MQYFCDELVVSVVCDQFPHKLGRSECRSIMTVSQ